MKFINNPKLKRIRYGLVTTLVLLLVLFWDLFFKIITDGLKIEIIPGFFWLESSHNYGAAYGIFAGQRIFLIITSIVMLAIIFAYNWFHKKKSIFYCISVGLIAGGAIGNLIDRMFLGYVRDFIRLNIFSFNCNVADICLSVGVALFIIYLVFFDGLFKKKPKTVTTNGVLNPQPLNVENKEETTKNSDDLKNDKEDVKQETQKEIEEEKIKVEDDSKNTNSKQNKEDSSKNTDDKIETKKDIKKEENKQDTKNTSKSKPKNNKKSENKND